MLVSDTERGLVYALTASSSISIYKPNGDRSIQKVQTLSNIYKSAQDKVPGSPALTQQNLAVVSLHVVSPSESRAGVQLIAFAVNGVRLFFGPSVTYYGYSSTGSRPLALLHVRLPPTNLIHPDEQEANALRPGPMYGAPQAGAQPTSRPFVVSNLDSSCYFNGLTIAAQPGDTDGTDFIMCLAPDLTNVSNLGINRPAAPQPPTQTQVSTTTTSTNRLPLVEYATLLSIPGRTWAVANVPSSSQSTVPPGTPSPSAINELATQFNEPSHQFMLLTNVGLTFLIRRRAVDYLRAALEELQTQNYRPIVEFRDRCAIDTLISVPLILSLIRQLRTGASLRNVARSMQRQHLLGWNRVENDGHNRQPRRGWVRQTSLL